MGFFSTLAWLLLYLVASVTVLLLLSARKLNTNYKYGLISGIGLLAFCIIFIRLQSKPFNKARLFYLNNYYSPISNRHSFLMEKMDYKSIFQDYGGHEIDIKEILERKRFLHLFESPPDFELMDVIVDILEKRGTPYLYVNFNILPSLEEKYEEKEEFWGLVAQSIISNFQKISSSSNKEIVLLFDKLTKFKNAESEFEQLAKWEYFAEIIETLYKKLEYINVVMLTEDPLVTDYLEGNKSFTKAQD